jgi:hypothetical protein
VLFAWETRGVAMAIVFMRRNRSGIPRPERRSAWDARLVVTSAAVLVAVLMVAGCSGGASHRVADGTASPGRPAGPDQAMVAWVGKVCAADAHVQQLADTEVPVTSDPPRIAGAGVRQNIGQQLQLGVAAFEAIGHAPVAGGDDVVVAYIRALKDRMPDIKQAGSYARGSGPMVVEGTNLPLLLVSTSIQSLAPKGPDLPSLIDRNPALAQAYRAAQPCQQPFIPLKAHLTPTPAPSR